MPDPLPRCELCGGLEFVEVWREGRFDGMLPCPTCRPARHRFHVRRQERLEREWAERLSGESTIDLPPVHPETAYRDRVLAELMRRNELLGRRRRPVSSPIEQVLRQIQRQGERPDAGELSRLFAELGELLDVDGSTSSSEEQGRR
jgi:hypothetical protein